MTTLAIMKARIASDLRRDDLTDDIADYITEAIQDFQHKRLYFNETRAFTFNTIVSQQRYGVANFPNVVNIIKIDSSYITIGGSKFPLVPKDANWIERRTTGTSNTGQSINVALYGEEIWLDPIPNDVWAVSLMAVQKLAAPAADGTAGNRWMTDCARMIKSQAMGHLYAYVIKKADLASQFYQLAQDAFDRLDEKTKEMTKTGDYLVEAWDPF